MDFICFLLTEQELCIEKRLAEAMSIDLTQRSELTTEVA